MNLFLWGMLALSSWVAGLFFLRFWASSRDRFFLFLGVAFGVLGLNWTGLAVVSGMPETRHYSFILRLLAFLFIIVGIIDKNRRARRE